MTKYIVYCGDRYYGPFETAGDAAEWATRRLPDSYVRQGLWKVLKLDAPRIEQ